jgi:hypothetical protein
MIFSRLEPSEDASSSVVVQNGPEVFSGDAGS